MKSPSRETAAQGAACRPALLLGGFGHASAVFDEWIRTSLPIRLVGAAQTLTEEPIDGILKHPWARQFAPTIYGDVDAALAAGQASLAVVSTRPGRICATVRRAVEAGLDVIAEKPLAIDEEELRGLFTRVRERGRRIVPMLSMRAHPTFAQAREWVRQGRIGAPVLVNARKSYKWGVRPSWFGERAEYGGTWPWVGIHALDMAQFITGLFPVSVTAHHANRGHRDLPGCEDICAGVFQLENGGLLTASIDILRPGGAPTHGDDYCRIVGTEGVIEAGASTGIAKLLRQHDEPLEEDCGREPLDIYGVVQRFAADPTAGLEETSLAFKMTDAVLQARESADTGRTMMIDARQWDLQ
jgi:predicted dehydrogenase